MNTNANPVFSANGPANKIYHNIAFAVSDAGEQIDVSTIDIQNPIATRFVVINNGTVPVKVGFDIDGSGITFADLPGNSWKIHLAALGNDIDRYGNDKTFEKIAFRCDTAQNSTVNILIE